MNDCSNKKLDKQVRKLVKTLKQILVFNEFELNFVLIVSDVSGGAIGTNINNVSAIRDLIYVANNQAQTEPDFKFKID